MFNLAQFRLSILITLLLTLPSLCNAQEVLSGPKEIVVWQRTVNGSTQIISDTLQRALNITRSEFGDYRIVTSAAMEQGRALKSLSKQSSGKLDIAHFPTTTEREKKAIAIRVPLIQGALGYRICFIKKSNQKKFTNINNKHDFINSRISIGQHKDWPDTNILRSNGLSVKTTYKYALLFKQLDKQRFDCFARGINEINDEFSQHTEVSMAIEQSLLLHYPYPLFFFVNADRPDLAERLTLGLTRLQKDGTLQQLFEQYYEDRLSALNISKRVIIDLENPTLSEKSYNALQSHASSPLLNKL